MGKKKGSENNKETNQTHSEFGEKADTSPYVYQRGKLKGNIDVKDLNWTEKQKQFIEMSLDKSTKIVLIKGPAGTSKSLMAVYSALKLLNDKKVSDIIYVRSAVESSDSKIGYLPGSAEEKFSYYNLPFLDKLHELLPKAQIDKLEAEGRISTHPINFSRGMSWNAKCIIFDEVQNSSIKEIITLMTRMGHFSKCFILADPLQTDLTNGKVGGFEKLFTLFSDEDSAQNGVKTFEFTEDDIMRSELVKFLVKKLKDLK